MLLHTFAAASRVQNRRCQFPPSTGHPLCSRYSHFPVWHFDRIVLRHIIPIVLYETVLSISTCRAFGAEAGVKRLREPAASGEEGKREKGKGPLQGRGVRKSVSHESRVKRMDSRPRSGRGQAPAGMTLRMILSGFAALREKIRVIRGSYCPSVVRPIY